METSVINDKVLLNYGIFVSPAIFNNLDETSNSIPTPAFYELLEEVKKNNIRLLNEDDFIIEQKASDLQMSKMKLDMQFFTDSSRATPETNADSTSYCM